MRLIDADALKKAISELPNDNPSYYYTGDLLDREKVLDEIDNAPTVEGEILTEEAYSDLCLRASRERPQGEWQITKAGYAKCPYCRCEREIPENFCGYCGADMRGKKK